MPESGELVRWMRDNGILYEPLGLAGTREFGLIEEYEKMEHSKCRPFNRITIQGETLVKEQVDVQGRELAEKECAWYEKTKNLGIAILPKIYETSPLM